MKLVLQLVFVSALFAAVFGTATIEPELQRILFSGQNNSETQNVIVSFTNSVEPIFEQINSMNFSSPTEKRTALTNEQIKFANVNQRDVQTFLKAAGVDYTTFWISNQMYVPNADSGLVKAISNFPSVGSIEKEKVWELNMPVGGDDVGNMTTRQSRQTQVTWGIDKIRANQVWNQYTGRGIVVAGIDSGVRHTHEALRQNWRQSYGWYDPYQRTAQPNDQSGHGTHTIATIAGRGNSNFLVGVAPEATWIACKGCRISPQDSSKTECTQAGVTQCGQWVQCPTLPNGMGRNCGMAPRIVSNSWGIGMGGNNYYDTVIQSWQSAGIIPVFSIGNDGRQGCGSARTPGDRQNNIAVGDMTINDRISETSSLGPPVGGNGRLKPDISAPGTNVLSAWSTADNQYNAISGTSMAGPHVSGVIALMLQKNPNLNYNQIYSTITGQAVINPIDTSNTPTCGGIAPNNFPNHIFGYGRIDALNCVNAV